METTYWLYMSHHSTLLYTFSLLYTRVCMVKYILCLEVNDIYFQSIGPLADVFGQILQGSGGYTTMIRRLYKNDQEVLQQGSGGYTTRIRRKKKKTFAFKWCKITAQKGIFSANFALIAGFFWYRCYYPHRLRDALTPVCGIFLCTGSLIGI